MVYSYLLDLYQVVDKRKVDVEFQISQVSNDSEKLQFLLGRLTTLSDFKEFLKTHYHSKLPRRAQ